MDNYSIIEGMIRQSTDNPIERDTTDDSLVPTPELTSEQTGELMKEVKVAFRKEAKKEPCNPFLFAEGEELRKAMMQRIYKGAGYHDEDQEFFKKLIDLMHYVNFLEHRLEKIKQEANDACKHL